MSRVATGALDVDPEDPAGVRAGRRFPYATVGDYVALSEVSDRACRIYWLLRMHVNGKRGDSQAWPTQQTLANILHLKKTDTIGAAVRELVELGAIDVEVVKTRDGRRNIYTVHEAPPPGFTGPGRLTDYYDREKAGEWTSPPGEGSPPNRKRIGGKTPVHPTSPPSEGSPPSKGTQTPPDRGDGSPPGQGSELPEVQLPEVEGGEASAETTAAVGEPAHDRNAPPPQKLPERKPERGKPETWKCPKHLADPDPSDAPCRECRDVRVRCERREAELAAEQAAAAEAARRAAAVAAGECPWCDGRHVLDPADGQPFQPAVKCDHESTTPEYAAEAVARKVEATANLAPLAVAGREQARRIFQPRTTPTAAAKPRRRGTRTRTFVDDTRGASGVGEQAQERAS